MKFDRDKLNQMPCTRSVRQQTSIYSRSGCIMVKFLRWKGTDFPVGNVQMAARYAVFDTLTDRDIREFDDLPSAYAEIDRLKKRHGTHFAVRPAQERRERIRTAQVVDLLRAPELAPVSRLTADAAQLGEPIKRGAALQILEAIRHLAAAVEQLSQDLGEIRTALQTRGAGRASGAGSMRSSAMEIFADRTHHRAEGIDAAVVRLGETTMSASASDTSHVTGRRAPISNGSRSALLTQLHELLHEVQSDNDAADITMEDDLY
jgi:hypothetical protein